MIMKKRLLSLVLAMCMLLAFAMPAFATDVSSTDVSLSDVSSSTDTSSTDTSSTDADVSDDVKAVYDAYVIALEALEGSDADEVAAALEGTYDVVEIFNEFGEEELAQLGQLMGCDGDTAFARFFSVHVNANVITVVDVYIDSFEEEPSASLAMEIVYYYDAIFNDPEYQDEELRTLVRSFFPEFDDTYAAAQELCPDAELVSLCDAYDVLVYSFETNTLSEVVSASDGFDAVVDAFGKLTDEQKKDLEELYGVTAEQVQAMAAEANKVAKAIIKVGTAYEAYMNDQSEANTEAFVEAFKSVINSGSENIVDTVLNFFYGIYGDYCDAAGVWAVRIAGGSRTETAAAISKNGYMSASTVILASGDNYADALAGGALAYALDAPILLVRNSKLDAATLAEIERLGAEEVYVLGGEVAISNDVVNNLFKEGYKVKRVAGATRFETAVAIANEVKRIRGDISEVFVVCSNNYPDALSVSGLAGMLDKPVLYIAPDGKLDDATAAFISENKIKNSTIIGGILAIAEDAEKNLEAAGSKKTERIAGTSRYDTCLEINKAYAEYLTGDSICVATGGNYPDALAGSVFAANNQAPILLVGDSLNADQISFINGRVIETIYVFGGELAVSTEVEAQLNALKK